MTQDRRIIETRAAVRNTPLKPRDWESILDDDDTEAVEVDGGEMALVVRGGQLHLMFAFDSNEVMKAAFNPMWTALKPKLKRFKSYQYCRFDLVAFPVREWIDHMLDEADFLLQGGWTEMEHRDPADIAPPEPPAGIRIRRAAADDLPRILEIEAASYGPFSDGPEVTAARFEAAPWTGVLDEDGEVVAYAINAAVDGNLGRTLSLGVAPEARGEQLGSTMLQAAAYQLAATGARRLAATARPDVPGSIDAARRVGYRPGHSGTEFRRSLDERANKERREQRHIQGMKVRFGDWR
ncbi:MAG: N-acetyltransferase family protein [Dehalococcoidia bacterium]